jgi:hypothetical protein
MGGGARREGGGNAGGGYVKTGDGLIELHYADGSRLAAAKAVLAGACPFVEAPPAPTPLILEAPP